MMILRMENFIRFLFHDLTQELMHYYFVDEHEQQYPILHESTY
jgi:hypothetical protein